MEFNSRDLKFKSPFGCVRQGENITINTLASPDAKVSLIIEKNEAFYTSFDLLYNEKTNILRKTVILFIKLHLTKSGCIFIILRKTVILFIKTVLTSGRFYATERISIRPTV